MRGFGILISLLMALSLSAQAEVTISNASVRLLPPGVPNTSAYFTINNTSQQDVYLVGAKSEIAGLIELHNHVMEGEVMKMQKQNMRTN